jgi:flagellar hook-length control protein FliK
MNPQFNKEHKMQNLTLQMAKAAPARQMANQDNAAKMGADNAVSNTPNAFAEMLKKQVKQKEAKPNEGQQTPSHLNNQAKLSHQNKLSNQNKLNDQTNDKPNDTASSSVENTTRETSTLAEVPVNEKPTPELPVEAGAEPIQDVILMQMGLQANAQPQANVSAMVQDEQLNTGDEASMLLQKTGLEKTTSAITTNADAAIDRPVATQTVLASASSKASNVAHEDAPNATRANTEIDVKKQLTQPLKVASDHQTKELDAKSTQSQINTTGIAQLAPAKLQETMSASVMAANQIPAAFGRPEWNQAVNQKVVWMVGKGEQSATLTLNPPDMGPLKVVIQVDNDHVDTTFISDNPEVRQALQDGMQMLRDKMQETGMQLGNAQVSSQAQSQRQFEQAMQQRAQERLEQSTANANQQDETATTTVVQRVSNGLVDTFA